MLTIWTAERTNQSGLVRARSDGDAVWLHDVARFFIGVIHRAGVEIGEALSTRSIKLKPGIRPLGHAKYFQYLAAKVNELV